MIVEAGDIGHGALHDWFIPTCVGQTPLAAAPGSGAAVHPHACGADPTVPSPRPWACPVHPHACGADRRRQRQALPTYPVHPHACGADAPQPPSSCSPNPVHPHACGADQRPGLRGQEWRRFIPTRVGRMVVHRVAGIDGARFIPTRVGRTGGRGTMLSPDGSSPRVWGGQRRQQRRHRRLRFIPTRVGRTSRRSTLLRTLLGSSPRVWGGPNATRQYNVIAAVHPHACGAD